LEKHDTLTTSQIKEKLAGKFDGDYIRATITMMEFECNIARVGQRYITDKTIQWGLFSKHYPKIISEVIEKEKALELLFLNYVKQFGPVCLDDFCWWLPMKKTPAKEILEKCKDKLIEFDFLENTYFMEKSDHKKFSSFESKIDSPVINFLPYEDHFPKAYKIRDWYITSEVTSNLYKQGKMDWGQIRPSIWLNGEIMGRWEMNWLDSKKTKAEILLEYLHKDLKNNRQAMDLVEKEKESLKAFFNEQLIPIMKRQ
jgi:hypothetical protein